MVMVGVWLWMCVGGVGAQNCGDTDVGVVVVASVFGTLAVVALVLGLILFLLRRRNGGVLFPKRGQTATSAATAEEGHVTSDSCYVNAAFSAHDVTDTEHGRKKSSPQKTQSPGKKLLKTDSQKTWVSLPGTREPNPKGVHRQGSCGSLGANYISSETESVWLLSQDIIGLGFNISGNMRDGIYVSQVHNRGPAIESGKIQVGDRLLSVTIGYENIVYEDALTILSYASPYPVKLTVKKEASCHVDTATSSSNEQLNHPVYRCRSLEGLYGVVKDPPFRPKRTLSEIKSDPRLKAERSQKASALSQSYPQYGNKPGRGGDPFDIGSDVQVHHPARLDSQVSTEDSLGSSDGSLRDFQGIAGYGDQAPTAHTHNHTAELGETDDSQAGRKKSRLDMEAAREFANLMDQVQEPPPSRKTGEEPETTKTAPSKPERKKKPSNSSTVSSDEFDEVLLTEDGVDETFQSKSSAEAESLPKSFDQQFIDGETAMGSENIELRPFETLPSGERDPSSKRVISVSLSEHKRIVSAERDELDEELIEASVTSRQNSEGFASRTDQNRKSREREKKKKTSKEKRKKKEEKKPVLSDQELERLIAMNSFPPGSQGWAGIHAGGKQGGVHDQFLSKDLLQQTLTAQTQAASSSARRSSSSSEASSQSYHRQKVGVAFEVRDNVLSGRPVSVDISRGSRNSSASPSRSGSRDRMPRASSMHDNHHHHPKHPHLENKENRDDRLDWSGKRLVRSGSFSQIPQDDSLNDWTDKRTDDDNNSTESGRPSTADTNPDSDPEVDPPRALISRDVFKARENLASMSDLSNSVSSSRSSSPLVAPNGPTGDAGVMPSSSGGGGSSVTMGYKNLSPDPPLPPSSSDSNGNSSKMVSVQLHTGVEEEMEC
ncbi:hypothetical protein ACOMHN_012780 [Nucella lapillus]